jgi:DNA replication protein DnaC
MTDHNQFPIPSRYLSPKGVAKRTECDARLLAFSATYRGLCGSLLLGPTGCGKTLHAANVADRIASQNSPTWVKWIRADELSDMLSDRSGREQVDQLVKARLLVIDELGYEDFPARALRVIGSRHDWGRPTLVTSGRTLADFSNRYADATVRKITDDGAGVVVDCWMSA